MWHLPQLSQAHSQGRPKCAKNMLKWRNFELTGWITGKWLKIDGYMLRGVWQALNPLFIHVTFPAIVPVVYPGRPKYALDWLQKLTHVPLAIAILLVPSSNKSVFSPLDPRRTCLAKTIFSIWIFLYKHNSCSCIRYWNRYGKCVNVIFHPHGLIVVSAWRCFPSTSSSVYCFVVFIQFCVIFLNFTTLVIAMHWHLIKFCILIKPLLTLTSTFQITLCLQLNLKLYAHQQSCQLQWISTVKNSTY